MKKIVVLVLLLNTFLFSLFSLSFTSSIDSVGYDNRFGNGYFPISGEFNYKANLPEFFSDINSSIFLNFNAGLKHRLIKQNPEDGTHFDLNESPYIGDARFYSVHFIYFDLSYRLGIINNDFLSTPILSLLFSLEGDFENSYERLGWIREGNSEATFTNDDRSERYNSYSALLEAKKDSKTGYRTLSHTGVKLSLDFNYSEKTRTTYDGLWARLDLRYMPSFFPLHDKNGSSYFSINAHIGGAYTVLNVPQFSLSYTEDVLTMFGLYITTEFDIRSVWGTGIPQYALERMSGYQTPNTLYQVGNRTFLVFTGPQIMEDLYPEIKLLSDVAYSFGPVANGSGNINELDGRVSLELSFNIFDTLYLYGKCGYTYLSLYSQDKGFKYSFGVRVGV